MWSKDARQLYFFIGLLSLFLLLLFGCSDNSTVSSPTQQTGTGKDANEEKIIIWELVLDDNPWGTPMFEAAAAALDMEGQIEIVQKRIDPRVYYDQQIPAAAKSNEYPDLVFGYSPGDIRDMGGKMLLFPINKCLETYPEFQNIPKSLWNEVTWDGNVWGFPVAIQHVDALFFNKRMLSELGWSSGEIEGLPEQIASGDFTLNDLLETATLATELGVVEPGFSLGGYSSGFLPLHLFFDNMVVEEKSTQIVYRQSLEQFFRFRQELLKRKLVKEQFMQSPYNTWSTRLLFNDSVSNGRFLFWKGDTHLWKLWSNSFAADLGGEAYMLENFGVAMIPAINAETPLVTPGYGRYYAIFAPDQTEPENLAQICAMFAKVAASEINQLHPPLSGQQSVIFDQTGSSPTSPDLFTSQTSHFLKSTRFWEPYGSYPMDTINNYALRVDVGEMTPQEAVNIVILRMQNAYGSQLIVK